MTILTFFLVEHLEWLHQPVLHALYDTHLGLGLVLHHPDGEGHCAELLGHVAEELPGVLALEHVGLVRLLVHGDLGVLFPALKKLKKGVLIKLCTIGSKIAAT